MATTQRVLRPYPGKQTAYIAIPETVSVIANFGGRNSGKSTGVSFRVALREMKYGAAMNCLILRESREQLVDLEEQLQKMLVPVGFTYNKQKHVFRGPNGGIIRAWYCGSPKDVRALQGRNITDLHFEELGNIDEPTIRELLKLFAALRGEAQIPVQFSFSANPTGPGANWIKRNFVDVAKEMEIFDFMGTGLKAVYLTSTVEDNLSQDVAEFEKRLRVACNGDELLYQAWRYGKFIIREGIAFPDWNTDVHLIDDFIVPQNWGYACGLDFGYSDLTYLSLMAVEPSGGEVVLMDELHFNNKSAFEAGQMIGAFLMTKNIPGRMLIYSDSSMWSKTGNEQTLATQVQQGIDEVMPMGNRAILIPVPKGPGTIEVRFNLYKQLLNYKKDEHGNPASKPRMRVVRGCTKFAEDIAVLPLDKNKPNQYATQKGIEEHSIDSVGYCLVSVISAGIQATLNRPTRQNRLILGPDGRPMRKTFGEALRDDESAFDLWRYGLDETEWENAV